MSFVLAFSAAVAWGASDFLGGVTTRTLSILWVLAISQACGLVIISVVFLASGAQFPVGWNVLEAALAGVFAVVALAMLYVALAMGRSARVGPIAASGIIVPVIVGLVEGSTLTVVTAVGMVLAGLGIVCSSWEPSIRSDGESGHNHLVVVVLAVGAALATGAYLTLIQAASASSSLGTIEVLKLTATSAGALAAVGSLARHRWLCTPSDNDSKGLYADGTLRRAPTWALVAGVGAADVAAEILFSTATLHGQLSVVSMISGLYPAITIGLFITIYKEHVNPVQLLGVVGAIAGLSLIAIGVC